MAEKGLQGISIINVQNIYVIVTATTYFRVTCKNSGTYSSWFFCLKYVLAFEEVQVPYKVKMTQGVINYKFYHIFIV